jgi:hypothetical protein
MLASLGRSVSQAVTLPLVVALETADTTARSLRVFVGGRQGSVLLRIPRYVNTALPLRPYDWLESLGQVLLRRAAQGAFCHERLLGCCQLDGPLYAVVTAQRLLVLACREPLQAGAAELQLQLQGRDVLHVSAAAGGVALLYAGGGGDGARWGGAGAGSGGGGSPLGTAQLAVADAASREALLGLLGRLVGEGGGPGLAGRVQRLVEL